LDEEVLCLESEFLFERGSSVVKKPSVSFLKRKFCSWKATFIFRMGKFCS